MENARLKQLKRQKELLLEHLEWLNREIDQETLASAPSPAPKTSRLVEAVDPKRPVQAALFPEPSDVEESSEAEVASDLYDHLGPDTKSAAADARRGCLIIGIIAFVLFGALVAAVLIWY